MKHLSNIMLILIMLLLLLVVGSWIIGVAMPDLGLRSLLSGQGVRWIVGGFSQMVGSWYLVWIIVIGMAWGTLSRSRLPKALNALVRRQPLEYHKRLGLQVSMVIMMLLVAIICYLTFAPHAVLLGITGSLFPSAFFAGALPLACLVTIIVSIVYATIARHMTSLEHIFRAMVHGISLVSPYIIIFMLCIQIYYAILFVFGFQTGMIVKI